MQLLSKDKTAKGKDKGKEAPAAPPAREHVMTKINLLPWRAELRKERMQRFLSVTGICVLISGLAFLGLHLYMEARIDYHKERNAFLEQAIKEAKEKIKEIEQLEAKRAQLIARMEVIQKLQSNRPEIVHLFEELVTTLPEGVYYTLFKQKNDTIELQGYAQSGARISSLMRNMEKSVWLKEPTLIQTRRFQPKDSRQILYEFSMKVKQDSPRRKEEQEAPAKGAKGGKGPKTPAKRGK